MNMRSYTIKDSLQFKSINIFRTSNKIKYLFFTIILFKQETISKNLISSQNNSQQPAYRNIIISPDTTPFSNNSIHIKYINMQRQQTRQLSPDQSKVRQIAEEYRQVEENTESLTQIVRYNSRLRKHSLAGKSPIDLRSFFCLIVQLSYLLYTCLIRNINLLVGTDFLARPPRKGEVIPLHEVYVQYLLAKEFDRMSPQQQQTLAPRFRFVQLTRSDSAFGDFIIEFVAKVRNLLRLPLEKVRSSPDGFYYRQMEGLAHIIDNFLMAQTKNLSAKAFILCLEESEAFREYGLLLKCLNNSIFAAMRFFPQCGGLYYELLRLDGGGAQVKLDFNEGVKRIQGAIEEAFKLLLKHQIIASEQSLTENTTRMDPKGRPYLLGDVEGTNGDNRKYVVRVYLKERSFRKFTGNTMQTILQRIGTLQSDLGLEQLREQKQKKLQGIGIKQGEKSQRCEYIVQYYSTKNLLCVKYVTNIELNIQNTDVLMFHCNYMSYNWTNITLQFVEKSAGKSKRKERYLCFKTLSYLSLQDRAIFKILTMIDILMVYAKVAEPQLRRNIYNLDQYCQRNGELNQHCEHLKQMFIRKVEHSYQALINREK